MCCLVQLRKTINFTKCKMYISNKQPRIVAPMLVEYLAAPCYDPIYDLFRWVQCQLYDLYAMIFILCNRLCVLNKTKDVNIVAFKTIAGFN